MAFKYLYNNVNKATFQLSDVTVADSSAGTAAVEIAVDLTKCPDLATLYAFLTAARDKVGANAEWPLRNG